MNKRVVKKKAKKLYDKNNKIEEAILTKLNEYIKFYCAYCDGELKEGSLIVYEDYEMDIKTYETLIKNTNGKYYIVSCTHDKKLLTSFNTNTNKSIGTFNFIE